MILAQNLCKSYGKLQALDSLSLAVGPGDIYGFIGPNGAGKSTTFKILATILRPDSGTVTIDGVPITDGDTIRGLIGYMPDTFGVYEDMTVYQYLDFFGAAYYIPAANRRSLIDDILELTDLGFKRDAMVQSLSRGMQQRLGVARVLVHDPKVLILDEPASGLDPRARIEFRELLRELSRMGKTIIISSHILAELSEICTRVGIVEQGRVAFEGSRAELEDRLRGLARIIVEVHPDDHALASRALAEAACIAAVEESPGSMTLQTAEGFDAIEEIPALLVAQGVRLRRFEPERLSLEKAFLALTEGKLA